MRNAPDKYGRVCIRVDDKEVIHGNPYDFYVKGYQDKEYEIKNKLNIPDREPLGNSCLYDKENGIIEDMVRELAYKDGVFEIYDFTNAIFEYKNSNIIDSINSNNMLVRMLAVMNRRVGKRTLLKLANEIDKQPNWLAFFYRLRLDADGIKKSDDHIKWILYSGHEKNVFMYIGSFIIIFTSSQKSLNDFFYD